MSAASSAAPASPTAAADAARERRPATPAGRKLLGLLLVTAALAILIPASLAIGANPLPFDQVWHGLWRPDDSEASIIVWTLRVPRTVLAIIAGVSAGVAGALIQAITRNPLADPGILGVDAGAGFAVTIGVGVFGITAIEGYIWFAFLGAMAATVAVYLIGSAGRGAASPVQLVLAGVALGAVLGGISTFLTLIDEDTFRRLRTWGLGSVTAASLEETMTVLPFLLAGLALAIVIASSLNAIALGDDLATSLGASVLRTRILGIIAVTLLAGGETALTGGIGFVGLMVPHVVRWFTGPDQRWILVFTILTAPVIVLAADILGRVIARPGEIQVGILTAVIGAPVLVILVRRRTASGL